MKYIISIFVFPVLLAFTNNIWADNYTITDLGSLNNGDAEAINNSGHVVGFFFTEDPSIYRGFLFNGAMNTLGTFGGPDSYAYDINNNGQIAGFAKTENDASRRAFIYNNGVMTNLGTLGGTRSGAFGINNNGQVVGFADISGNDEDAYGDPIYHAFRYSNGSMVDLGTLGGSSSLAHAINDSGVVVGWSYTNTVDADDYPIEHAFIYSNGVMSDLGTFGGNNSSAHDINNNGVVVGDADTTLVDGDGNTIEHAFVYLNGTKSDLGTWGGANSSASAINNNGLIVGDFEIVGSEISHAFLYKNGVMLDLNNLLQNGSGWILEEASDINDAGQIVGTGTINGQTHAFLITPVVYSPDTDGDGIADNIDNCPTMSNSNQLNTDSDSQGNACDDDDDNDFYADAYEYSCGSDSLSSISICPGPIDTDNDGYGDIGDNCPTTANPDQLNDDADSQGNVCDPDYVTPTWAGWSDGDGDGIPDFVESAMLQSQIQIEENNLANMQSTLRGLIFGREAFFQQHTDLMTAAENALTQANQAATNHQIRLGQGAAKKELKAILKSQKNHLKTYKNLIKKDKNLAKKNKIATEALDLMQQTQIQIIRQTQYIDNKKAELAALK